MGGGTAERGSGRTPQRVRAIIVTFRRVVSSPPKQADSAFCTRHIHAWQLLERTDGVDPRRPETGRYSPTKPTIRPSLDNGAIQALVP